MMNYEEFSLDNGLRVFLKDTGAPTVFGRLRVKHATLNERAGEEGLAHFLEHMVLNGGTEKFSPEDQNNLYKSFGFSNGFTSKTSTMYPVGMFSEDIGRWLDYITQTVFHPRFDDLALTQQGEVVCREMERKFGSPGFQDFREMRELLTRSQEHMKEILGTRENVLGFDKEDLVGFHSRGYHPDNMDLILVGGFPRNIREVIENSFGEYEVGEASPQKLPNLKALQKQSRLYRPAVDLVNSKDPEKSNSHALVSFVCPDESHEDWAALALASEILGGGGSSSRLGRKIRTEKGLAYSIGSAYWWEHDGVFRVFGKVYAPRQEEALEDVFVELGNMRDKAVSEDELERAQRNLRYRLSTSPVASRWTGFNVDPAHILEVSRIERAVDDGFYVSERLQNLEAVTGSDILRVARQYFPENRDDGKYVLLVRDPLMD